jgi:hypothetical protein
MTQIPDGMGAGAIIQYHTTIDVWHSAQPYCYLNVGQGTIMQHIQEVKQSHLLTHGLYFI